MDNQLNFGQYANQLPQAMNVLQQQQPVISPQVLQGMQDSESQQETILPNPVPITQHYGNYNPSEEVFSQGVARGTNLGAKEGDTVALPPGNWQVVNLHDRATTGGIGNGENAGYGNAVLAQNTQTGELLHFTHLSKVNVKLGQPVSGNTIIGAVGGTGNADAPHLNLEYYDQNGKIGDVMQSPYAPYIPVQGGQQ